VIRIARGGRYISATLAERLSWALDGDFRAPPHDALSDREMQVLLLLGAGHSVKEASETLRLSMKTVSTFRKRMMKKMSFLTNADAVQYVVRQGLLRADTA
jgi:two-component system invasion response regulator UvrY